MLNNIPYINDQTGLCFIYFRIIHIVIGCYYDSNKRCRPWVFRGY